MNLLAGGGYTWLLVFALLSAPATWADFRSAKDALKSKDFNSAADQFRQFSRLGHAGASFELAKLMEEGRVAESNTADALAWYMLAEDQGHEKAARKVKSLTRKASEADVSRAQEMAADLRMHSGRKALEATLLPEIGGRPAMLVEISKNDDFDWPRSEAFRYRATLVHLEFDVTAKGYPRDFRLVRESRDPYVEEVLKGLRKTRYQSVPGLFSQEYRFLFFKFDEREQYGNARLLRKLRRRAENGSPARKYSYAYAQELAENFGYGFSERDSNEWFLDAAKGGHTKAQYVIGYRTFFGYTLKRDIDKGWRWLSVAAGLGNARANYFVARALMREEGAEAALPYLEAAAEGGHTTAMLWLARMLAVSDVDAAVVWLNKATPHLDQVSWHLNAEEIYLKHDPEKSKMHRAEAEALAEQLDAHIEPLELIAWKERGAA